MRGVSGIEMALWDLTGKILDAPATTLLGGKFRDRVHVYDHAAPRNMLDPASCRDWAEKVKADPAGSRLTNSDSTHTDPAKDIARDLANRVLTIEELSSIRRASRIAVKRSAGITTSWCTATGNTIFARRAARRGSGVDPPAVAGRSDAAGLFG